MERGGCIDGPMSEGHRSWAPTDEDLLEELRRQLAARGKLSSSLIEASEITRAPNTYIPASAACSLPMSALVTT